MGRNSAPSLRRLKTILDRQDPPRWGEAYLPAILATREEAPSRSRPAIVHSSKFKRDCHVLSSVELKALILALYNPSLFEIHEQRMLPFRPSAHPLQGHPCAAGMPLPRTRGTVVIAERLGLLHHHPIVPIGRDEAESKQKVAPFPLIGDFLLFLKDELGPYCVNWTVKRSDADFDRRFPGSRPVQNPDADATSARARHAIEELTYRDVSVPTVRVTEKALGEQLSRNLYEVFLAHALPPPFDGPSRFHIVECVRAAVMMGRAPLEVLLELAYSHGYDVVQARTVVYQAIWARELRVNLFGMVLIDVPLEPERVDVLDHFKDWFGREGA
jgi:hypothetical protein